MKRSICLFLALLLALSLMATGCRSSQESAVSGSSEAQNTEVKNETFPAEEGSEPEETVTLATVPKDGMVIQTPESDVEIAATGAVRVDYAGNISSVRYITSVSQLPDYPELAVYDEDYFQEHALVLVLETVTNGTVAVDISGIYMNENTATVQLSHEAQGDMGTAVMTTWLVWAEVEAGLDYTWNVGNPAVEPNNQRY